MVRIPNRRAGVSPVVATILLIAITVVAVGVVAAFVVGIIPSNPPLIASINVDGATNNSTELVLQHAAGGQIKTAFTPSGSGIISASDWGNMEVRVNGAKVATTNGILDNVLVSSGTAYDFVAGDMLTLGLAPLQSDDVITIIYKPAMQVLKTVIVPPGGTTTNPMWTSATYRDLADTSPGDVWFSPETGTPAGTSYSDEVHVNSGTSKLGAYKFIIIYNENVISVDKTKGDYNGADEGADGFVAALNTENLGKIIVNGFSATGTGPGEDLHVLTIYWTTVGTGTTTLDLTVEKLTDEVRDNIGTPNGLDGARTVE